VPNEEAASLPACRWPCLRSPTCGGSWMVRSDIPGLAIEISRLRDSLTACRIDRANLAAAGRATITAYRSGESDPLSYLYDELLAQGFGTQRSGA